jgi:hypothetical protein
MRLLNKFRFNSGLFVILTIIVFSCSIDDSVENYIDDQNSLTVEEAKFNYDNSFKNSGLQNSRVAKKSYWDDVIPDWSKSRKGNKHKNAVITPLKHPKFTWIDKDKNPTMQLASYKDKKGKTNTFITQFKVERDKPNSGILLYRDSKGFIAKFYIVKNGIVAKRYYKNTKSKKARTNNCNNPMVNLCFYSGNNECENGVFGHMQVSLENCPYTYTPEIMSGCMSILTLTDYETGLASELMPDYIANCDEEEEEEPDPCELYPWLCGDGGGGEQICYPNTGTDQYGVPCGPSLCITFGLGDDSFDQYGNSCARIKNNLTTPCFKNVLSALKSNHFEGQINYIFQQFNKTRDNNFTINEYDGGVDGDLAYTVGDQIYLNTKALEYASKELIAACILHEMLHVHINRTEFQDHVDISEYYINPLAAYLSNMFGMNLGEAKSLLWAGLQDTPCWEEREQLGGNENWQSGNYLRLHQNKNNFNHGQTGTHCTN